MSERAWAWAAWSGFALLLAGLSWLRPIDHDESQYVAAAVLTAHGLLPYRDYLYLQTPLQPFLFAPVAALAGGWTWPALRLVNALLGAAVIGFTVRAARAAGASRGAAIAAAGLLATCDIFLFSIGTARNDALPAACFAAALWLAMCAEHGEGERGHAVLAGLLLAAASAAKISYVIPAAAYGVYALAVPRHRPGWLALGGLPIAMFVGWSAWTGPAGFWFGVFTFPAVAPSQYYWAIGRAAKLSIAAKAIDALKFLALGPALLALGLIAVRPPPRRPTLLNWLIVAALLAAVLPTPTWRQYLLPILPPLFIRLAQHWTGRPPHLAQRIAVAVFACIGFAPTLVALATSQASMTTAVREAHALRAAMDAAGVPRGATVASLSPEFVPATGRLPDPRFAAGPFYFRSRGLMPPAQEQTLRTLSYAHLPAVQPALILVGGEGAWTSGDGRLDAQIERWAIAGGLQRRDVQSGHFRVYVRPR